MKSYRQLKATKRGHSVSYREETADKSPTPKWPALNTFAYEKNQRLSRFSKLYLSACMCMVKNNKIKVFNLRGSSWLWKELQGREVGVEMI